MSFYNMLFGQNAQSDLLLAAVGLRESDVERFRDVSASDDGRQIAVYTRTGGGNRDDYPQEVIHANPLFERDEDDDFDCTYATFYFRVPEEFAADVAAMSDPLENGIRREFAQHLAKTLRREPTEGDKHRAAYDVERQALSRTKSVLANGHTFVPYDDSAMKTALELAEANGGKLRTAWGILPLVLNVKRDFHPYPKATDEGMRQHRVRVEVSVDYGWKIDADYWQHCQERFAADFPVTMAKIAEDVARYTGRAKQLA